MAGRGTDIKLEDGVPDLGGLHVIGSERHDSRRIDRQLRGRCARQGDPGSSSFYVSLEDNLMRLFGSDRIASIMSRLGLEEGEELQHPLLNKSISTAQKRVEQQHYAIRKRTLEFDDVMNKQREVIYSFRKKVLLSENPREIIFDILRQELEEQVDAAVAMLGSENGGEPALKNLLNWLNMTFPIGFHSEDINVTSASNDLGKIADVMNEKDADKLIEKLKVKIEKAYLAREDAEFQDSVVWLERNIMLEAVDRLWQEHLYCMDNLRSSINLRAYAQKDPLMEYKQEAFKIFSSFMAEVNQEIMTNMFRSASSIAAFENLLATLPQENIHDEVFQFDGMGLNPVDENSMEEMGDDYIQVTFVRDAPKVGRNDPCPCGSGKKFKKCCGQNS
jgi:preprotein translocase subunit SecA